MVSKRKPPPYAGNWDSPAPHNESCKVVNDPAWNRAREQAIEAHRERVQAEIERLRSKGVYGHGQR